MREILFRGKVADDYHEEDLRGKWVEGNLIHQTEHYGDPVDKYHILYTGEFHGDYYDSVEVIPETVGQFTGSTDKNGKKIFEGDIISTRKDGTITKKLKGYYGVDSDGYPQRIPGYEGTTEYHYPCQTDCYAEVKCDWRGGFYLAGTSMFVNAICNEVVGNIHDNPELLEVK